ncbi:MAG: hypothetical protein JNL84_05895 [Candidatus Accumulibacter sp.]|nr:hypothetical protein [Accumulibacter sp.]
MLTEKPLARGSRNLWKLPQALLSSLNSAVQAFRPLHFILSKVTVILRHPWQMKFRGKLIHNPSAPGGSREPVQPFRKARREMEPSRVLLARLI